MARDFTIKGRISVDDDATRVVDRVRSKFAEFGDYLKDRFVFGPQDVAAAFRTLTSQLGKAVEAAGESEDVNNRLDAALARLGPRAAGVADALRAQAAAIQSSTRYNDEAVVAGQALLASFVDTREEIESLTASAVDFAASGLVDLDGAFRILAKAAEGNTATLSRYGIVIDEGIPKAQKLGAVQKALAESFGGRAQADAATYRGAIAQITNAYDELLETAGKVVTQNRGVRDSLTELRDSLRDDATTKNVEQFGTLLTTLATSTLSFAIAKFNSLAAIGRDIGEGLDAVGLNLATVFQPEVVNSYQEVDRLGSSLEGLLEPFRVVTQETLAQAEAAGRLAELNARNVEVYARVKTSADDLALAATKLGVTLSTNVNNSIYENEQALKVFDAALALGTISLRDYRAAVDATTKANRELLASVSNPEAFVDGGSIDTLKQQLRDLGVVLRDDVNKTVRDGDALWRNALAGYKSGRLDIFELSQTFRLLSDANVEARDGWLGLADAASGSTSALAGAGGALDVAGAAATRFAGNAREAKRELAQLAAEAANFAATSQVFDRSGNQLPPGGKLELGGTRYTLPDGGSVLVGSANGVRNPASNLGVNYKTGGGLATAPFSGRYTVDTAQYGTIEAFKVASYGFGPSGAGVSTYGVLPGGRIVLLSER